MSQVCWCWNCGGVRKLSIRTIQKHAVSPGLIPVSDRIEESTSAEEPAAGSELEADVFVVDPIQFAAHHDQELVPLAIQLVDPIQEQQTTATESCATELWEWKIKNNISNQAIDGLLKILHARDTAYPKSCRRLIKKNHQTLTLEQQHNNSITVCGSCYQQKFIPGTGLGCSDCSVEMFSCEVSSCQARSINLDSLGRKSIKRLIR
jgi:hypothetical protein